MLPLPLRASTDPEDVISFIENKVSARLLKKGSSVIRSVSGDTKLKLCRSDGDRYSNQNMWFVKLHERDLLSTDSVVIWSTWTPFGWVIPSDYLLSFLRSIPMSDGHRWDPRMAIKDGRGFLWTDQEKFGALDITGCHVNFSTISALDITHFEGSMAPLETAKNLKVVTSAAALGRKDTESLDHLQRRAERDQRNRELGFLGEQLVFSTEVARLYAAGMGVAADNVQHVARKPGGDRLGYDIQSFDLTGKPRLLEVKTTRGGARTPFFISANEVRVSEANPGAWSLVRVFDFDGQPECYEMTPSLMDKADFKAVSYQVRPRH